MNPSSQDTPPAPSPDACPLCREDGAKPLWAGPRCRIVLAGDPDYPAFCRVIWQAHVAEMTDLAPGDRDQFMTAVWAVESALREVLAPHKVNLASLGNQVPHLHWHVIPRFADDAHFPDPVWAARRRPGVPRGVDAHRLAAALARRLP